MALRVLRLVAVASIFAFVLTVRTVAPIVAASGGPADDSTPVVDSWSVLGEEPPIDLPPPPEPPTEPPPVDVKPPPFDNVEPAPTDPPPDDTVGTIEPPPDPDPVEVEPPPADVVEPTPTDPPPADAVEVVEPPVDPPVSPPVDVGPPPAVVEPAPTDPPADTVEPVDSPADPAVELEPPPADTVEPAPTSEPITDTIMPPLTDPFAIVDDPAGSDSVATKPSPPVPTTYRSTAVPPVAAPTAQAARTPVAALVSLANGTDRSPERAHVVALHPAIAAGAGLAAGLVVTNHAPSSVAVAMEFGRAGGGWAGALVFNLWLRRQMRERRMSLRRLADLAGVDHSTISRLLRQDRRPSLTTATKLASALKQVPGDGAEPEAADYFERIPEETVFPARRVELALRADEMLNDDQVRRLMNIYLEARRRNQASAPSASARSRAAPARAAPDAS